MKVYLFSRLCVSAVCAGGECLIAGNSQESRRGSVWSSAGDLNLIAMNKIDKVHESNGSPITPVWRNVKPMVKVTVSLNGRFPLAVGVSIANINIFQKIITDVLKGLET